jgi:hypothetical protein
MADDAPYDGKAIGEHIGDAARDIGGFLGVVVASQAPQGIYYTDGEWCRFDFGTTISMTRLYSSVSRVVPTAREFRPGSISSYICIRY